MALFNIIDNAGKGYRILWTEREYLLRLAAVPLLMKMICWNIVVFMGWEADFIMQSFAMLPSYFTDGWMVSHLTRLIFFDQRWPFRMTGNMEKDMKRLQNRAQGVMSGTIVFVLMKYLSTGLVGVFFMPVQQAMERQKTEMQFVNPETATNVDDFQLIALGGAFVLLLAGIWAFRYLWFYIPAAANCSLGYFNKLVHRFSSSFHMIGLWLICFLPFLLLLDLVISVLMPGVDLNNLSDAQKFSFALIQVFFDTTMTILMTAGMAFAFKELLEKAAGIVPKQN